MKSDLLLYQNPNQAADRFLSAFLSLLKHEQYKDITITQLCQEAQLSRKTFYENFKKKDDLWYQINIMTLQHYIPLLSHRNWNSIFGKQIKNKELIFYFFNAGYSEVIKKWALNNFKESPEELAEMVELIISEKFTTTSN